MLVGFGLEIDTYITTICCRQHADPVSNPNKMIELDSADSVSSINELLLVEQYALRPTPQYSAFVMRMNA